MAIKLLGLDVCADTIGGDQLLRGISGGQKKRVTSGIHMQQKQYHPYLGPHILWHTLLAYAISSLLWHRLLASRVKSPQFKPRSFKTRVRSCCWMIRYRCVLDLIG